MSEKNLCCVDNYPVLIPYEDFVRLATMSKDLDTFRKRLSRTDEQLARLRSLYSELLEKFNNLD